MHKPIENYKHSLYPSGSVTQWFAMNPALYSKLVCYDDPSFTGGKYCLTGHNGIDIVAPWGTPLLAVKDGVVGNVENSTTGFGKAVRLFCKIDDKTAEEWIYGHCADIYVKPGQSVKAGEVIATMGNTGFVVSGATPYWKYNPYAGTHLHLGKRYWNLSKDYGSTVGDMKLNGVKDYYNGYYGYVDFADELASSSGHVFTPQETALKMTLSALFKQFADLFTKKRLSPTR